MKMIKFSRYVVLGAALAVVTGCNDAKLSTIDNGVYIAEAAPSNTFSQQIEAQLVDEGDVIKTLTVRLGNLPFLAFSSARRKLSSEIICSYKLLNLFIFFVFRTQSLRFPYQHLYELCYLLPIGKVVASYVELILKNHS